MSNSSVKSSTQRQAAPRRLASSCGRTSGALAFQQHGDLVVVIGVGIELQGAAWLEPNFRLTLGNIEITYRSGRILGCSFEGNFHEIDQARRRVVQWRGRLHRLGRLEGNQGLRGLHGDTRS